MNEIDLAARNAVVTGGARGIGYAIAERMLQSGARVALWDRDTGTLAEAAARLGNVGQVTTAAIDITDSDSVRTAAESTVAELGGIDILVNNAGVAGDNATVWETPVEEWRRVVEIDLTGTFICCREIAARMIAAGYGRIVNIASIAGKEGNPNAAHYSAAKAGVIGLTKSLGKELAETGVTCNCITPAVIETPILEQVTDAFKQYMVSRIPMARMGSPDEVAALVAWLASEDSSFSTGAVFDISGGRATY
ncbi:MAG: SDR family NAD(P)-dependent oxidoreductase [Alphaproteobacteria bacterium]|jgi:3-oxoacyl-[acyl-carrier protein] reductase|nr:SDR family NAD(P)-dependent oxidoreductase [Alphaproteobacteria bacterium]